MATQHEIERLAVVETEVKNVKADVQYIKTTQTAEFAKLNTKIDGLDKKFAAKWVQSAVTFVIGLIIAAVLTAWLAFVVIKPNQTPQTTNPTSQSTGTTSTGSTPSANANASAQSTPSNPTDTQSSSSGGLLDSVPKVTQ